MIIDPKSPIPSNVAVPGSGTATAGTWTEKLSKDVRALPPKKILAFVSSKPLLVESKSNSSVVDPETPPGISSTILGNPPVVSRSPVWMRLLSNSTKAAGPVTSPNPSSPPVPTPKNVVFTKLPKGMSAVIVAVKSEDVKSVWKVDKVTVVANWTDPPESTNSPPVPATRVPVVPSLKFSSTTTSARCLASLGKTPFPRKFKWKSL